MLNMAGQIRQKKQKFRPQLPSAVQTSIALSISLFISVSDIQGKANRAEKLDLKRSYDVTQEISHGIRFLETQWFSTTLPLRGK